MRRAGDLNGVGVIHRGSYLTLYFAESVGDEYAGPRGGALTSPNYPEKYPNNATNTQTIRVPEGKRIRILFTLFEVGSTSYGSISKVDYVTITDKDGTKLAHHDVHSRLGIWASDKEKETVSNTNTVFVTFVSSEFLNYDGWRLEWGEFDMTESICCIIFSSHILQKWLERSLFRRSVGF